MALALITGCSNSTYTDVFNDPSYKTVERRAHFKHFVVEHFPSPNGDELHIYIEGDGLPWTGSQPSTDPTPRNPIALELMMRDNLNAIYVGRPCYFNHYARGIDTQCDAHYWTNARYSPRVVDDMSAIAARYIGEKKPHRVILIGYSGGGVLATMMACALPKPLVLITLGANLDVAQWSALHNYSPLALSLNPVNDFAPCEGLSQHHVVGADDEQVPPAVVRTFTKKFQVPLIVLPKVDHKCCWADMWAHLLEEIRTERLR